MCLGLAVDCLPNSSDGHVLTCFACLLMLAMDSCCGSRQSSVLGCIDHQVQMVPVVCTNARYNCSSLSLAAACCIVAVIYLPALQTQQPSADVAPVLYTMLRCNRRPVF